MFTRIVSLEVDSPATTIVMVSDGPIPFPQIIVRDPHGREWISSGDAIRTEDPTRYEVKLDQEKLAPGAYRIQGEGCTKANLAEAGGGDWIKAFAEFTMELPKKERTRRKNKSTSPIRIYFGIHKHMHQPYYDTVNPAAWDGEKDSIFATRAGAYKDYLADAIERYVQGGLPHAGISTSWSGSLIEQLDRCEREGLCGGQFAGWKDRFRAILSEKTRPDGRGAAGQGHARLRFTAFGFFHPLMPLIPERDIIDQILRHRDLVEQAFGVPASRILFPPETAFHVRMIPALKQAGIEAVIYDSVHRSRACRNYPYPGKEEGMLPPNPSEQVNDPVDDWCALQHVWAPSKISPSLLKPEYVGYTDPDGTEHTIIAIPAERYLGNEDARGGFGALQYPSLFEQLHREVEASGSYDLKHPPFFLLHSDGDNYGGGTDSYYRHNTEQLVAWLNEDPRFELIGIEDYLDQFPPDPDKVVHIEPGSWAGADNGDPQFMKWFSRYREPSSPDLHSWAVLTSFQNAVHSLLDAGINTAAVQEAERLMLLAETSCYWYWTGQAVWDAQVTHAANHGWNLLQGELEQLQKKGDTTGPTIFPAWVLPENPGG
ncbi:MAG: glycosyl hydrolase family 57, partial [Kiritimatiellae bacterium]|nr:glycosyl hydrolase family 57 [Kiritimatiellia bacterium]